MRKRLSSHPLLNYLLSARLIQVHVRPLAPATERKLTPLLDRRGGASDAE
jgi:hypothetical protein